MAQQIVVAVLKKQIEAKKKALETAIKLEEERSKKYFDAVKKANDEYNDACEQWKQKALELALKQKVTGENITVSHRNYWSEASITISVPISKLPKYPEKKDVRWEHFGKAVEIPRYYDSYHRPVSHDATLAHFTKALEMLEVLPNGTVEVQVKDFNFLTKF